MSETKKYKRILLKLSGEVLAGGKGFGVDTTAMTAMAAEIAEVARAGVQLGLVIGGGNFFRGVAAAARQMDRVTADSMGMLATVINCLAMQDALLRTGVEARTLTAIRMPQLAEPYTRGRAVHHLERGRIVLLAGGTSNPYFSTDSAGSLRALEIGAELLAKATSVDGVYDQDPRTHAGARRFDEISYSEVLAADLRVMDAAAVALCRDNRLPIRVFNLTVRGNIMRVSMGEPVGTVIR